MTTRDTLHFLTCGHVDDGKSTLIGRLLSDIGAIPEDQLAAAMVDGKLDYSRLTDGLEDERAQGITIDVAYRYFRHRGRHYRIADTPGHVQYVRNMAVAAANSDCALILVDASHGVRDQTIRHSKIAAFFGIRHFVVAVNKMDLIEYDEAKFREIERAYCSAMGVAFPPIPPASGGANAGASGTACANSLTPPACGGTQGGTLSLTFIPVSAREGDNLTQKSTAMPWYRGPALLDYLAQLQVPPAPAYGARLPVQYVIRTPDHRRGYQGMLSGGRLRVGDRLAVADSGAQITVTELYHSGKQVEQALPGQAITLCTDDDADIARGNVLYSSASPLQFTDAFIGDVLWLDPAFSTQDNVQGIVKIHNREEQAELHVDAGNDNATVEARIFTAAPVATAPYAQDRATGLFLVIQPETEKVIGVGTVRTPESADLSFAI